MVIKKKPTLYDLKNILFIGLDHTKKINDIREGHGLTKINEKKEEKLRSISAQQSGKIVFT